MDLHFNARARFTRWIVKSGHLREPFVVVDVGVQGGESPRWHLLGDHLVIHGFDAIKEVIDDLRQENRRNPNLHYHWVAAGIEDGEREFYFNAADPRSSSFFQQGEDRFGFLEQRADQVRRVPVRRLDTLLKEGVVVRPDFLKNDVEGLEKDVFLGAKELLSNVLGVECETSFSVSPTYPEGHLATLQRILLERKLLAFDLNFNRIPRGSYWQALQRKGLLAGDIEIIGKPATFNVLFCRNPIDEADRGECYAEPYRPLSIDQLIKTMIIYELYGLNDIAFDTAQRFRNELGSRFDVDEAIDLLLDPACLLSDRTLFELRELRATSTALAAQLETMRHTKSWRLTEPLRNVRRLFGSRSS